MNPWTPEEVAFLRECATAQIGADKIAPMIGRSVAAVRMKRCKLGIRYQYHISASASRVSVARIQSEVAKHFGVTAERMAGRGRGKGVIRPRQVAMFFAREVAGKSFPKIGHIFGRDHSTVIHAVRKVERMMGEDQQFKDDVKTLFEAISSVSSANSGDKWPSKLADAHGWVA